MLKLQIQYLFQRNIRVYELDIFIAHEVASVNSGDTNLPIVTNDWTSILFSDMLFTLILALVGNF